jgi:hypothetical protein
MGLTATSVLLASTLLNSSATVLRAFEAAFHKSVVCLLLPFAFQLGDLDTGLGNDLWFMVIVVVVAIGAYIVYRGPKHM